MRKESYETRYEMAVMHDKFLDNLTSAMAKKQYIEASWLCYAIFEQRIRRIVEKHIKKCPKGRRSKNEKPVSITTKLVCLKKLCKQKYGPYADFDKELLDKIGVWSIIKNMTKNSRI